MHRKQKTLIIKDLSKKMVFLVGPRQAGKTWLTKNIAQNYSNAVYLNYDHLEDRAIIKKAAWQNATDLLILDELHKMPEWKNYLKGIYDTKLSHLKIIVTGSARLDIFQQVGDSLAGRFFTHHLLPFSPAELKDTKFETKSVDRLLIRGGFPEPFLAENEVDADRWRMQYCDSLLREDIFDIEKIDNIKNIRLVFELLRIKVGSPISYKSIAEDVGISPNTVKKYIRILEALYVIFRVTPFSKNIARSLIKEPKIYFFDAGLVKGDIGAKLENLTAVCLLKHVYAKIDYEGQDYALHYIRTKDGMEIDFALVKENEIEKLIEVKNRDHSINKPLLVMQQKYGLNGIQLVNELRQERSENKIDILRLENFLRNLML